VAVAELSRSRSRSLGRYDAVADVKKANGGVKYDAFNAAFCKVSTNVGYFLLVCLLQPACCCTGLGRLVLVCTRQRAATRVQPRRRRPVSAQGRSHFS
jgi:hypothetical protein